ncbi:MAG: SIS domain-containing protein [Euryarchaeota archaeon]|nr:SIS domain-containing protein [Euryarchaeota archaeon]
MLRLVIEEIVSHIKCMDIDDKTIDLVKKYLKEGSRIFVCGFGESELVGVAFASRIKRLHKEVFVVTETIVPAIEEGDALLAISGSGDTEPTLTIAKKANKIGAKVISVTSFSNSSLAQISDVVVEIPGRIKAKTKNYIERRVAGEYEPLTPFGALFEISTRIFLEGIIAELANNGGE